MNACSRVETAGLSIAFLQRTAQVLRLLAHPRRLKVVAVLEGRRGVPVGEIAARVGLPPAATSQHLNQMRRVGLLASRREGRTVLYRIADERSLAILDCIRKKRRTA